MAKERDYDQANREALAAAAMAFAPATDVPRERALTRSAITLLLLHFGKNTFKRPQAINIICDHGNLPELRKDLAKTLFDKLILADIIQAQSKEDNPDYQFKEDFCLKISDEQNRIDHLIEQTIRDLFDTANFPREVMPQIRKEMLFVIAHLMEAYGKQYAYQVAGKISKPVVIQHDELVNICGTAISKKVAKYIKPTEMARAITELFAQKEPHFAQFVFALTQNYYYLRLLGLGGGLAFLSDDRSRGSHFLIDTNLLFPFLLDESKHRRSILELMEIVQNLNISLHETELSLEELRNVINYHKNTLIKVYDEVPDELEPYTNSVLLQAYRNQKSINSTLAPEEFFSKLLDVRQKLIDDWDITVLDEPVEHTIDPKEFQHAKQIINECSIDKRQRPKGDFSLTHDAHLYYLVLAERERMGDKNAWLLTLDTSLPQVAKKLQPNDAIPFCMTLDGFLHIISPYVRSDHQQSFSEMFVELVVYNLFPFEETIMLDDFLMFTDFDLSIRSLPSDDVTKVIRHVKHELQGEITSPDNRARVAYEVQKALSDPTLLYHTELEDEIKKREAMIENLEAAKDLENQTHISEKQRLQTQLEELRSNLTKMSEKDKEKTVVVEQLTKGHQKLKFILKCVFSFLIIYLIVIFIWLIPDNRLSWINKPFLFKISVSFAATFCWIAVLSRKTWIQIILFILSGMSVFFAAYAAFFK